MRTRVALFALLLATSLFSSGQVQQDKGATFDPDQKPLKLASGRVFPKWEIISETASTVTIRYPGGAAKVDKKLLPENLQAIYKIDPVAVAAEAKADAEQKLLYDEQVRATAEKQKEDHDAVVAAAQEELKAKAKQESEARKAAANLANATNTADQGSTVTRGETHDDTPRTATSEVSDVVIPPEAKRQTYVVEYEIVSNATALDLRYGQNGQHNDVKAASVDYGWTQRVSAKTGDRLYFSAHSGGNGGEEFTVRIKVDGRVVKEATGRGTDSLAETSYTIP